MHSHPLGGNIYSRMYTVTSPLFYPPPPTTEFKMSNFFNPENSHCIKSLETVLSIFKVLPRSDCRDFNNVSTSCHLLSTTFSLLPMYSHTHWRNRRSFMVFLSLTILELFITHSLNTHMHFLNSPNLYFSSNILNILSLISVALAWQWSFPFFHIYLLKKPNNIMLRDFYISSSLAT